MERVAEVLDAVAPVAVVHLPASAVGWLAVGGIALALHDLWRHFRSSLRGR